MVVAMYRVSQKKSPIKISAGDFRNFPWDVNLNTLDLESFGYTMEHFKYGWKDGNKSVQVALDANVFGDIILAGHRARKVEVSLTSADFYWRLFFWDTL